MVPFTRQLLANWLLPALLIGLAHSAFAPASAEAGCGDYVMIGVHGRSHAGIEAPSAREVELEQIDALQAPVRRLPCSGPQCSGDAPRPFGVPATPLKIVVRQWGIVEDSSTPALLESRFARFENDAGAPRLARSTVYRPPR